MDRRDEGLERVPRNVDACMPLAAANLLRQSGNPERSPSMLDKPWTLASDAEAQQAALRAVLSRHWDAIRAEGITASQFVDFLQPLADLDGIDVSYVDTDEDPGERVDDHRRNERDVHSPPSQAARATKLSGEGAPSYALLEEDRALDRKAAPRD
jgi:hypothetical protein